MRDLSEPIDLIDILEHHRIEDVGMPPTRTTADVALREIIAIGNMVECFDETVGRRIRGIPRPVLAEAADRLSERDRPWMMRT